MPKTELGWIGVLLLYAFLASVLPVWLLLQPRDYINSFQLYFALGAMLLGMLIAGMAGAAENHIEAPFLRANVPNAPSIFPFLFVTVACGAVSGFHSLVSSGTTVKQLNREADALPIGYGAMLVEAALAILVILACMAGLAAGKWGPTGPYADWKGIGGGGNLATQLSAVVHGGANFLYHLGIPRLYGRTFLAVTIVAFAMTTLDSATRLLRFNVEEIGRSLGFSLLRQSVRGLDPGDGGHRVFRPGAGRQGDVVVVRLHQPTAGRPDPAGRQRVPVQDSPPGPLHAHSHGDHAGDVHLGDDLEFGGILDGEEVVAGRGFDHRLGDGAVADGRGGDLLLLRPGRNRPGRRTGDHARRGRGGHRNGARGVK